MHYYRKSPKGGCHFVAYDMSLIPDVLAFLDKCPSLDLNDVFAADATVTEISDDRVTVQGCNGVTWTFPAAETFGCDPFTVGSAVTLLMWQMPDTGIQDSIILDIHYDHSA